jgi:dihydrofolate reductase
MDVTLIAAVANKNVIGNNNSLIWHLPEDLKHFKKLTTGHAVIMGRKTYQSIGKPLKERKNIIITRHKKFEAPDCFIAHSLEEALEMAKNEKEVFIAGGSEIYQQSINLPQVKKMHITRVFAEFQGDAFFPVIDCEKWQIVERQDREPDEKNQYPYAFLVYERKEKQFPTV